ncbi:LOB domain-containing protein 24-like [Macadamia integrifolia]|uniref:LOB domain-containing protein 24-like n=1 Tax=Macadamia integrifolia TaxID=60698 RepID=UPI001C4FE200|nr:LOB domain-containing protein 24-like [Macadamia integrifolia]
MSHSTRCAACKSLRRRCPKDCILAPYFPSNDPQRFASVHKIFGAGNITKILQQLPVHQRAEAADCMSFEATSRIQDPVYGCVGILSQLQQQILITQRELEMTQAQLAFYSAKQQQQEEAQQEKPLMAQSPVQYCDGPSWFYPNQQDPFYLDQQHLLPPGFL